MVIETNCWLASSTIHKSRCTEGLVRSKEVQTGTGQKQAYSKPGRNHEEVMIEKQCHGARPPSFHHL